MSAGRCQWFFPDAERPPSGSEEPVGHESLIILNPNESVAEIRVTLWFELDDPVDFVVSVSPMRVRCLRTDDRNDMGGHEVVVGRQYAIGLHSNSPIVAQYGRLDIRQPNMAFYTTSGYCE